MGTHTSSPDEPDRHPTPAALLGVYLNDHLTGASGGVDLARRLAREHQRHPHGEPLAELAEAVAEDRAELVRTMRRLDVPVRRYKVAVGRLAEQVGRLKPNRALVRRSPLSSLLELEGMRLGTQGKAELWSTLLVLADDLGLDRRRLETLLDRAHEQADALDQLRLRTAREVFGTRPAHAADHAS
ncbi:MULTISPECIES: hypothetical protein [Streptomyces]|uniref:hypothetical protein n=1 Tax=Streptomyces TaxID=1883 RepID=UPI0022492AE2|nr:hypothetical protein [Streptomyces sp. JHD 1]MCX2967851.1 hypothetical protein [Streptomyces sp. JHD 1]